MITVTPTLHVATAAEVSDLHHVDLVFCNTVEEAVQAIESHRRAAVSTLDIAHAVLRARGIDPASLPTWADGEPDDTIPPAPQSRLQPRRP